MNRNAEKKFLPEGSLWTPTPIAAINRLIHIGNRPAARVLQAISNHLGPGLVAVFPSYPRLASYACVSENNLREHLNTLQRFGYLKIEKVREGKKTKNYYTILDKAWLATENPKSKWKGNKIDTSKEWICHSCWRDVLETEAEQVSSRDGDGKVDKRWVHSECWQRGNSARLEEATEWMRWNQAEQRNRQS